MAEIKDPENTILIELKDGTVIIELLPDVAPQHAARMKELAREGAYDGVVFHRVIDGFMAQTGDVQHGKDGGNLRMAGTGGSSKPDLPAEFSKLPHDRGTLGAARSQNPNSANSQFFINFSDNHFLNGQYTVYGRVIDGMEHVDAITRGGAAGDPGQDDLGEGGRRCLGSRPPYAFCPRRPGPRASRSTWRATRRARS